MESTISVINFWTLFRKMIKYNMKVIFGSRFVWFVLAAMAFYFFIAITNIYEGNQIDEGFIYGLQITPGLLLIFYPMTFGIQNDLDAGILEILFGIPDYRYKVWLVRLLLVFVLVFLMMLGLTVMSYYLLAPVSILELASQVMFPVYFLGSMAFMFSTIIKNGNGTAVVMVIIGVGLLILSGMFERTMWNIFLNPFEIPNRLNEMVWQEIAMKNRIFQAVGSLLFILYGLFNLQNREKFL
ncbi:MAG: hypothetical protein Q7J86_06195 [Bacteroidota bacterium]|nr:hypothetical protein [Bacteroidota bacterium]MDO9614099.1 hypothetical protein [Bacteroidota bacterium]